MKTLYTSTGRLLLCRERNGRYPKVVLKKHEYILDMQEMIVWSILHSRIISLEELQMIYECRVNEIGFQTESSLHRCLRDLTQRGFIAEGKGETDADALYDLISDLYLVPMPICRILRVFTRLKDKRTANEKIVSHLADHVLMSTAEVIKCFERKVFNISCEDDLMNVLYQDKYTTDNNIIYEVRYSPECRSVLTAIANLYLRHQIAFDRL